MTPSDVLAVMERERATAILRTADASAARPAMEAAVRGGFRSLEFTLTTPGALDLIADFSKRDGLVVGAGTVLTVEEAKRAVDAGASFLVSPVVDEEVIEAGLKLDVVVMPGTHTPTEMLVAHRAGAQLQKVFPCPAGGPDYVRACLGPLPFLRLVPTNGVDADNVGDFLRAGSFACGFVAPIFDAQDIAAERFERVEERARRVLDAVRAAQ